MVQRGATPALPPPHLLLVAVRGRMLGSWLPAEPTDPLILQLTGSWAFEFSTSPDTLHMGFTPHFIIVCTTGC